MTSKHTVARRLAAAIADGRLVEIEVITRLNRSLGRQWRWLGPFARRLIRHFGPGTRPLRIRLERFIQTDEGFSKACRRHKLTASTEGAGPPAMSPAPGRPRDWKVPEFHTVQELCAHLHLTRGELAWFADARGLEARFNSGPLRHYAYRWHQKKHGLPRLIESPKQRLKGIQRWILSAILDRIPAHPSAHGFRTGRSIVTFVSPHIGRRIVLRIDLQDFFPSISAARIRAIFMTAGYPEDVARVLTGCCTNTTPFEVIRSVLPNSDRDRPSSRADTAVQRRAHSLYARPHLPQGAPTSPALANLAAFRLDCRLAGLAQAVGAEYTRYADDLVFSGDDAVARQIERLQVQIGAIILEEGFEVNHRKTRIMRPSVSQRAAGLVLNSKVNVPRRNYDELKAILHHCARSGPSGQNRAGHANFKAHLEGRVAHVEHVNPARGGRLRKLLARIQW